MNTKFKAVMLALAFGLGWLLPQCGHAFYNPSTGKWISRDPIEEKGGINLTLFAGNKPISHIDRDGRVSTDPGGGRGTRPTCCPAHNAPKSCDEVCAMARSKLSFYVTPGGVVCYGGMACPCIAPYDKLGYAPGACSEIDRILMQHEESHIPYAPCLGCGLYPAEPPAGMDWDAEECKQRAKTLEQLRLLEGTLEPGCAEVCRRLIQFELESTDKCP